ncbi:hypothetical protein BOX15_Mlig034040g1 [Macrostomum lignano]|uniref:Uncharacterized protein n=1 Tax=Macrostomum lignano TaxID=282301 RepID=A0A267ETE5_9PLAT|nr:hypothetical protein BOX15_Mlig034040g1 [Macrostomum lignano]
MKSVRFSKEVTVWYFYNETACQRRRRLSSTSLSQTFDRLWADIAKYLRSSDTPAIAAVR